MPPMAPLFVPASRPDRFQKAVASGTDALILDLEDAVAAADKDHARANIVAHASELKLPVIVRVNAIGTPWHEADVDAIKALNLTAIMLPKAESAADIENLRAGVPVIALIETAVGLSHLSQILDAPNLAVVAFGSIDFALDLRCSHEQQSLLVARSEIVWRSRAARRAAPLEGVTTHLADMSWTEKDSAYAASLGFGGKMAIHPKQIAPIKAAFRPSDELIAWARQVLVAAETGSVTRLDGEMVDRPVIDRARWILADSTMPKLKNGTELDPTTSSLPGADHALEIQLGLAVDERGGGLRN